MPFLYRLLVGGGEHLGDKSPNRAPNRFMLSLRNNHLHVENFGWGTWIRTKIDGVRVPISQLNFQRFFSKQRDRAQCCFK
jgi:hypothetical protein